MFVSEAVTGPVQGGYFLAAYASRVPESSSRYLGYYKICRERPPTYWEADCVWKGCTPFAEDTPNRAIEMALAMAMAQVRRMPDAQDFPQFKARVLSGQGRLV